MKLLAIRLDSAGDVLMCSPALRALHESGHTVSVLTSSAGAPAAGRIPGVDSVLVWAAPWMKSSEPAMAGDVGSLAERLRPMGFDGAVIFTSYSQSPLPAALLCQMAGIPLRLAHCRENPYQLLTHWVRESEPEQQLRHEVERQTALVAQLGCRPSSMRLSVKVSTQDLANARAALESAGIDADSEWILLHPGASAPSRRYPASRWHDAASLLAQQTRLPLVFAGGRDEVALVESIVRSRVHDGENRCEGRSEAYRAVGEKNCWPSLAGQLDFGALAALISMARVLVACNSAPAHLAAATGTPIVDLYALTNPQHTPWQVRHRLLYHAVPCHDCYQSLCPYGESRCLSTVEPREILHAVQSLLQMA